MRLSDAEKSAIVSAIQSKDPAAQVYLFGSRARDDLKGGDIDLLVVSNAIDFSLKLDILVEIKARIGDQRIDLKIVSSSNLVSDPFAQSVLPSAVRLTQ